MKTKKELTASVVTSLVSRSLPPLPQAHLGGQVAFFHGVCTHTHLSHKLASSSVFTSISLPKTGALETVSAHTQERLEQVWKAAVEHCGSGLHTPRVPDLL